jgi:lysophospholipase L1-like esterase
MSPVRCFAVLVAFGLPATAAAKTKIACVGASTTSGDGSSAGHHYPDELQRLVAPDVEVKNFGVSGTTMLRAPSASYWTTPQYTQALAYQPDVAIIWFGGNDAKPENWTAHKGEFLGDYEAMIEAFQALPSHPRTFVILSLLTRDTEGIPKAVVDDEVIPLVRQAAAATGSGVVDVHDQLAGHPEYFPDGIHPNDMGTVAVARLVYAALGTPPDGGAGDASRVDTMPVADASADVAPSDTGAVTAPAAPLDGGAARDVASPPAPTVGAAGSSGAPSGGAGGTQPPRASSSRGGGGCAVGAAAVGRAPSPLLGIFVSVVSAGAVLRRRRGGRP